MRNQNTSTPASPGDLLRRVKIASPCVADWEKMSGDDKIRHCPECDLNVYNLSAMSVREAAHLISTHQGRLCARICQRAEGAMLTEDGPANVEMPVRRVSRLAGAALSAAMTVTFAAAQPTSHHESQSLAQIDHDSGIVVEVLDPMGAVIPFAEIILVNQSTQKEFQGATGSSGSLRMMHLPAGSYSITVSSQGFEHHTEVVTMHAQQTANLKVTLKIGMVGEVVVVDGSALGVLDIPVTAAVVDDVPIPLEPIAYSGGSWSGPLLPGIPGPKPRPKSIFARIWRKLGF